MTDDRDDTLLAACLEEVLGGRTPPDLTARILHAWEVQRGESVQSTNGDASVAEVPPGLAHGLSPARQAGPTLPPADWEPVPPPIAMAFTAPAADPVQIAACNVIARDGLPKIASARLNWLAIAIAIGTIAIGVPTALIALRYVGERAGEVAKQPGGEKKSPVSKDTRGALVEKPSPKQPAWEPKRKPAADAIADKPDPEFGSQLPFGQGETKPPERDPTYSRAKAPAEPDAEVIAFVNQALRQSWEEQGVKPSVPATDAEWCRRIYVRVVGRIPTVDELKRFTASKSLEKKEALVDQMLTGEAYREEFARHWAEFFANALIGRTVGTQANGPVSRDGLLQYLRRALLDGKSYDRLAYDLLTATGSGQPGSSDYNGATNFLLANLNEKGVLATSRTSRVFLGKQLQCAQCHNHPSNEWSQNQFWELNAFFRQTHALRDRESGAVRLVNRDFRGEGGDPAEAEVYYELPNGRMKVAYPVFPGGHPLPRSGLVSEVDRRTELARRVVASDDLARAAVNRLWAHFLGFGFTRAVDDMGPHNPPSHPELLGRLSDQFAAHDYRLPSLIRWIVLSDAFGVSSKVRTDNLADAPEAGERPLFSRYYTRQMQPEQVYQSLQIAAAAQKNGGGSAELEKARLAWLGQFTREMGTDDGEEQNTFTGDIRQSLIMMNGPLMQRAISREHGSLLDRVAQSKMPFEEKVEHLFLAAVARQPVKRELDLAAEIHAKRGDAPSALQDIWWALLNSNEFILDH